MTSPAAIFRAGMIRRLTNGDFLDATKFAQYSLHGRNVAHDVDEVKRSNRSFQSGNGRHNQWTLIDISQE
jgi:hypothetical protein